MSAKDRYDRDGVVRWLAEGAGYVMARRSRCMPFILPRSQWERLGATKEAGAAVEVYRHAVRTARTTAACPDCGRPHAEFVLYPSRSTNLCPVREFAERVESGHGVVTARRELAKAKSNCAKYALKATIANQETP